MQFFSFKMLALGWTGLAGLAAVGAGALQASYVAPPRPLPVQATPSAEPAPAPAAALPVPAPVPFENRSLLAMLPPAEIRPHPAPRPAAAPPEPLPVPPIPPLRVARADPPRHLATRAAPEPAYAAPDTVIPGWGWGRRLPYPGQYASGRGYYYGGAPSYYGWQPEY